MKYLISINETNYYLAEEIEANSREEAERKYMERFDNGDVSVNKSELSVLDVEEI